MATVDVGGDHESEGEDFDSRTNRNNVFLRCKKICFSRLETDVFILVSVIKEMRA